MFPIENGGQVACSKLHDGYLKSAFTALEQSGVERDDSCPYDELGINPNASAGQKPQSLQLTIIKALDAVTKNGVARPVPKPGQGDYPGDDYPDDYGVPGQQPLPNPKGQPPQPGPKPMPPKGQPPTNPMNPKGQNPLPMPGQDDYPGDDYGDYGQPQQGQQPVPKPMGPKGQLSRAPPDPMYPNGQNPVPNEGYNDVLGDYGNYGDYSGSF